MGVYVKNMSMPKCCKECDFCDYEQGNCLANEEQNTLPHDGKKKDWCPLVEVPEPHGRLIDENNVVDAVHERLQALQTHKEFIKKHGDIDLLGVLSCISKIQTVIEAEGE